MQPGRKHKTEPIEGYIRTEQEPISSYLRKKSYHLPPESAANTLQEKKGILTGTVDAPEALMPLPPLSKSETGFQETPVLERMST